MNNKILSRLIKLLLIICIILSLSGCSKKEVTIVEENAIIEETEQKESNQQLDRKEMIEDFDVLYTILIENYPFIGYLERKNINLEKRYINYRKKIIYCKNKIDFYMLVKDFLEFDKSKSHLGVVHPITYQYICNILKNRPEPEYDEWKRILLNKNLNESYEILRKSLDTYDNTENNNIEVNQEKSNIETKIIEIDKIAYLKINSFSPEFIEKDNKKLLKFYGEIEKYNNLVIDLSCNSGGSTKYWIDNIVSPNIDMSVEYSNYFLFKNGNINMNYLKGIFDFENEVFNISELPYFENINKNDISQMQYFYISSNTIIPNENQKIFNGSIWIISGENVFSASEEFVNFSKQTNFATIVGQRSSGDGIGINPLYVALPNSRIVIQYEPIYGINTDGSSNLECGTTPDIETKKMQELETIIDRCNDIKNKLNEYIK